MGIDLIYYAGGAALFLMARAQSIVAMRGWHVTGSALCVLYGVLVQAWPVAILNGGLGLVQLTRLIPEIFKR